MAQITSRQFSALPIEDIEVELRNSLNPVRPDPFFVSQLGQRLKRQPAIVLEEKPFLGIYLIMATGLFLGAFLIWVLGYFFHMARKILLPD